MGDFIGGPGFKAGKKKEEPEEVVEIEVEDLGSQTKKAAVKALFSAMKAGDVAGGIKALDAFMDCGSGKSKTEEEE